jgi:hypothetical protein
MSTSNSTMVSKANKEQLQFKVNSKLAEFKDIKITSSNKGIEQVSNKKDQNQDQSEKNKKLGVSGINNLKNIKDPDATYNYKKDFLVLSFNQTEDQNSLEYKRKILAKKLMKDITFSLNKAFEFSFEDKIKNNIIMTLSKNSKTYYDYDDKKDENYNDINNQFILNFCNGEIDMDKFFIPVSESEIKIENKDVYLGNKNTKEELENSVMEDEIAHAKKNYAPQKGPELVKNLLEDEEFDVKTYNFFLDYIEKFKEFPLASKIKLVLSYITEVNPHTKRDIYTNKDKNILLRTWKEEYDKALQHYNEKIKLEMEKKKKDQKKKTRIYGSRESVNTTINSFINKKKANVKNPTNMDHSSNNINTTNDNRGMSNYNNESSKQKISLSRDNKK